MTRRNELLALMAKLDAIANDSPQAISLSAAQYLAEAAERIERALQYAVSADEVSQ